MKLKDLIEVSDNVDIDEYLCLYKYVRDNMEHPEWLGTFSKKEIKDILKTGGKIWMYYDKNIPICSFFYIPASNKNLKKHNIEYDESITGSLGPIMVRKEYIGNGLQREMMKVLEKYIKKIGKKHIYTKAHSENTYSINNFIKSGYKVVDRYASERGPMISFVK